MANQRRHHNPPVGFLIKQALKNKEAIQARSKALVVYTGKYTGRSPNDKFIVDSKLTHNKVDWGKVNRPISQKYFDKLHGKVRKFFDEQKEVYIIDTTVGASKKHHLKVRIFCQYAYQALFATHLFRQNLNKDFRPDLTLYCAPSVTSDPKVDGTNSEAFIVLDVDKKTILIGGTKYAGEIKKSVFSYMNYLLPLKKALPMHCSANKDKSGKKSALFFGLSGTGKTTLSADPKRSLIGDDEHGWDETGVFNFEGGCYAKCIRLREESEPQIWRAVNREGALLENVLIDKDGRPDFDSDKFTENTRAVYPLEYIANSVKSGSGPHPSYVIFLTADASGVLPPVAKLTLNQAAYHFLSGYTSKLAGTERGIVEPKPTFSAYFGAPFMPLKPMVYLNLLKTYLKKNHTEVFLVNTGWVGGGYGSGKRISIKDTRAIVTAILSGKLDKVSCRYDGIFNLYVPEKVPGVDDKILDSSSQWEDKNGYLQTAKNLARLFYENIKQYKGISKSVVKSGPKL